MPTTAFDGLRVLELGVGTALAYAGKLLRDLGADVIKVEAPAGDELRRYGPFPGDEAHPERSGLFIYLNGGKQGGTLDLEQAADRRSLEPLLPEADVLLHSFTPARARDLGLAPGPLLERHPRLVIAAVTPFGSSGPRAEWKAYAIQEYAASGVAYRIGEPDRAPLTAPLDGGDLHHGGPHAAASIALALLHRDRTGRGQFVDLSVTEAINIGIWGHFISFIVHSGHPMMERNGRMLPAGWFGVWGVADGDYVIQTMMSRHWETFLEALGSPPWTAEEGVARIGDPAFARDLSPEEAARIRGVIADNLGPWLQQTTKSELWKLTRERRLPFHPVLTVPEVCESDQIRERRSLVTAPGGHPTLQVPRAPYLFSGTPALDPGTPPTLATAAPTGWRSDPAPASPPSGQRTDSPLEGLRVLDLGQVWAGPLAARYLADYGADVVWIRTGTRPLTSPGSTDPGEPLAWEWIFRNRRSLALDLSQPGGAALFRRLAAVSDVVIDNFSPRVMPGLGLGYEELVAANPRLIMIAMPPAGRSGPWQELLTFGPSLAALFGLKSLNGYPEDRRVVEDTVELDPLSASYATLALFAALYSRSRSGRGQLIELAQGEAGFAGIAEAVIEHGWNGRELGPVGNTHRTLAPHGNYRCAGEDEWIAIACGSEEEWRALAAAASRSDWLHHPAWQTAAGRRAGRLELDQSIGAWTAEQDKAELAERLQHVGVAAYPVLNHLEVIADEQLDHRRHHFKLHPDFTGGVLLDGNPWHLSAAPPALRRPAPALGAHNAEVLAEYLGMPAREVERLEAQGVLA